MRLLLDTHVYLWWLQDHPHLSPAARARIMAATDIDELVAEIDNRGLRELPVSRRRCANRCGC